MKTEEEIFAMMAIAKEQQQMKEQRMEMNSLECQKVLSKERLMTKTNWIYGKTFPLYKNGLLILR